MSASRTTSFIKQKAQELGFDFCGIAKAEELTAEARQLESWLSKGYAGTMSWLHNHFELRIDPRKLVPGAKSVVCLGVNYTPPDDSLSKGPIKLSRYAYGRDYHKVLRKKLKELLGAIREEIGEVEGRAFVDSGPVMEKVWAERAGIGWLGKNGLLLRRDAGSYFFLCELILELELEPDSPVADHCGTCTRCMDACPTDAIPTPQVVDGSKCISYLTIELKDEIPKAFQEKMEGWAFGCDICQEVCPWTRFAQPTQEKKFLPSDELQSLAFDGWEEVSEEIFARVFEGSAVKRTGLSGLRRNLEFLSRGAKGH